MKSLFQQKFEDQYIPEPMSGCWLWTGRMGNTGYGSVFYHKTIGAHRASWKLYRGKIPNGLYVLHKCDTRPCVNPEHLFLGTQSDNMKDMVKKGRSTIGQKFGELSPLAKLSEKDVICIFKDKHTQRVIAKKYGIAQSTVYKIKNKKRWFHILYNL